MSDSVHEVGNPSVNVLNYNDPTLTLQNEFIGCTVNVDIFAQPNFRTSSLRIIFAQTNFRPGIY